MIVTPRPNVCLKIGLVPRPLRVGKPTKIGLNGNTT